MFYLLLFSLISNIKNNIGYKLLDKYETKFHKALFLNEWDMLAFFIFIYLFKLKRKILESNMDKFWNKINIIIAFKEKLIFKNIVNLVILRLTLLYFNANGKIFFK